MTKNLVELLGGSIKVSCEYGKYVDFEVHIPPLKKIVRSVQSVNDQERNESNLHTTPLKDITILVVDDEKNICELLSDILSPYYHILEAKDGQSALEIVKYNHPSIIITDVMMPNMDGILLVDKLKSDMRTMHIPIVCISAKVSSEDSINAYKHGVDLYIRKPFLPLHVLSVVENLIKKHSQLKNYYTSSLSSLTVKRGKEIHREEEELIRKVANYINRNISEESLNPESLADFLFVSKATLYREFKRILNSTPSEFIRTIRLEYASKQLIATKLTVLEIMYKSGFNNKSYFYREFTKMYKVSPNEYRNKHLN